ncbi:hypothetical protein DM01DRAFT_1408297 [Hesseltinella vesiculosa]|uniref:DH domain-containing protein n=1 Tax=Hesseltinella vesiculosa TaxID=101127 RepID=A0A1X2GF90_9FUNG|nr:hypothetical protein DM01DRAFT_1408297 [Hesseltinella vesiculosa]
MNIVLPLEKFDASFYEWPSFETTPYAVSPKHDPNKKQKQTLRCLHAMDELVQTERDYVKHLTHLVKICFAQVLQFQPWIRQEHKSLLMRNANQLLQFHQRFLLALEEIYLNNDILTRCGHIANVFLDMGSSFTFYDTYCDKHDLAVEICNEYRIKPEWAAFTKDCTLPFGEMPVDNSFDQGTKPLRFEDYLIKPVQRICRYQLLLKEIIRYAPKDTTEYRRLDCSLRMMQAVVAGIDRRKYNRDNSERTLLFLERLDTLDGRLDKDCLLQLGNVSLAGPIDVAYSTLGHMTSPPRSKYLGCFLFSSYLILVRPKKTNSYVPKYWFPLRTVELDDLPDDNDQANHTFVLRFKKHCFAFTATCSREKKLWLSKLTQAIDDAKKLPDGDAPMTSSFSPSNPCPSSTSHKAGKIHTSRSLTNLLDFAREPCSRPLAPIKSQAAIHRSKSFSQMDSIASASFDAFSPPPPLPPLPGSTDPPSPSAPCHLTSSPSCLTPQPSVPSLHPPFPKKRHSVDFSTRKKRQPKARIHSEMYVKPPPLLEPMTYKPHRGSVDVPFSTSQMSISMLGKIKSNHQQALRIGYDDKLRDVCTQDYLASRSWSVLLRESSINSSSATSSAPSSTNPTSGLPRRKSSLSNLRSSASSFSLFMSCPSRRVSDGSNTTNTTANSYSHSQIQLSSPTLHHHIHPCQRLSQQDTLTSSLLSSTLSSSVDPASYAQWNDTPSVSPSQPIQIHAVDPPCSPALSSSLTTYALSLPRVKTKPSWLARSALPEKPRPTIKKKKSRLLSWIRPEDKPNSLTMPLSSSLASFVLTDTQPHSTWHRPRTWFHPRK